MELRKYQKEAINNILENLKNKIYKQMIVLPTGSGKTVILSALLKKLGGTALIIAHRNEILNQTADMIKDVVGIEASIYSGINKSLDSKIVVGSIQSCHKEKAIKDLREKDFDVLIIDEAHHSMAKTYLALIDRLNFNRNNKLLLGFTATPNLKDGNVLGEVYEKITFTKNIDYMIENGFLANIIGRKIETNISLDGVRIKNKDYLTAMLDKKINIIERNELIVEKYKQHSKKSLNVNFARCIAFCATVLHAKNLKKEFIKEGIPAEVIYGEMKQHERSLILKQFKKGELKVLTSIEVLTEGINIPEVNMIIMARPTRSKTLYIQMVGRGLRTHKNKNLCIILDFADQNHSLRQQLSLNKIIPKVSYEKDLKVGDKCDLSLVALRYSLLGKIVELSDKEYCPIEGDLLENMKKNRKEKILRGIWTTRPPYGYKKIRFNTQRHTLEIKEPNASMVKEIFFLYTEKGFSFQVIQTILIEKYKIKLHRATLCRIIKDPFYYGIMKTKDGLFPHIYETLISKELHEKAQIVFNDSKSIEGRKNTSLASFLKKKYMGKVPYGYKWHFDKLVKKEGEYKILKAIFTLYSWGTYSSKTLTIEINRNLRKDLWLKDYQIKAILANKFYDGISTYKNKEYKHEHEEIITSSLFKKCEKLRIKKNNHILKS